MRWTQRRAAQSVDGCSAGYAFLTPTWQHEMPERHGRHRARSAARTRPFCTRAHIRWHAWPECRACRECLPRSPGLPQQDCFRPTREGKAMRSAGSGRAWQGTRERAHAFSRLLNQERVACLVRVRTTAFEELPSRKPKTRSTESNPNCPAGASDCRTRPPKTDQPEQPIADGATATPLRLPAALAEGPVSEGTRAALTGRAAGNRYADRSRTSEPM